MVLPVPAARLSLSHRKREKSPDKSKGKEHAEGDSGGVSSMDANPIM